MELIIYYMVDTDLYITWWVQTRGYTSWRCITSKCCGRLRVGVTGDVVVYSSEHNHKPHADQIEVKNVVDEIQPRELENLRNEVKNILAEIQHRELENLRNEVKKVVAEITTSRLGDGSTDN